MLTRIFNELSHSAAKMSYFYKSPGFEVLCSWEKAKNVARIHIHYGRKERDSIAAVI